MFKAIPTPHAKFRTLHLSQTRRVPNRFLCPEQRWNSVFSAPPCERRVTLEGCWLLQQTCWGCPGQSRSYCLLLWLGTSSAPGTPGLASAVEVKQRRGVSVKVKKRIGRYKWDCFFFFSLLLQISLVVVLGEVAVVRAFNSGVNPSPHWHQSWAKTKVALYTAFVYLQHWTEQKWHKYCPTVRFMQASHRYTITDYLCVMLLYVSSCSYKAVLSKKK